MKQKHNISNSKVKRKGEKAAEKAPKYLSIHDFEEDGAIDRSDTGIRLRRGQSPTEETLETALNTSTRVGFWGAGPEMAGLGEGTTSRTAIGQGSVFDGWQQDSIEY